MGTEQKAQSLLWLMVFMSIVSNRMKPFLYSMYPSTTKPAVITLLFTCAAIVPKLQAAEGASTIKCWQNAEQVKECGNAVPPEYVQQGYKAISQQGILRNQQPRAKTREELDQEKQLLKQQAEQVKLLEEQKKADRILLNSFGSTDELVIARDSKIATLDGEIKFIEGQIAKYQANLDRLVKLAALQEHQGKQPSNELVKDIDNLQQQIKTQEDLITSHRQAQTLIQNAYNNDLNRYKALNNQ